MPLVTKLLYLRLGVSRLVMRCYDWRRSPGLFVLSLFLLISRHIPGYDFTCPVGGCKFRSLGPPLLL